MTLAKFTSASKKNKVATAIDHYHFREALMEMMNVARHGNKLLTEKEPWKTFKTDPEANSCGTVRLYSTHRQSWL
jgi:methionyl-tRNA synthetase